MPSAVDVASKALGLIGSNPITSLSPPDDNKRARAVAAQFDDSRDATLQAHPWNFATQRASIPVDATAPVWGFTFRYLLPNDCIRLLEANGEDRDTYKWRVESGYAVTDLTTPLEIRYVAQITDSEAWSPLFVEAMAAHLASLVAEDLTGMTDIGQTMLALFERKIGMARSMDGFEQTPFSTDDDNQYSWLAARY